MTSIDLTNYKPRAPQATPAELIARALEVVEQQSATQPDLPPLGEEDAARAAGAAMTEAARALFAQLDPLQLVEADERLERLTAEQKQQVADLIDGATMTINFQFDLTGGDSGGLDVDVVQLD